jgi:hypothetical protein
VKSPRHVASATLGIVCAGLLSLYPVTAERPGGVASASESVRIESPVDGAAVSGRIDIRVTVTADDPDHIDFYRIYVGNGRSPAAMRPLGSPRTAPALSETIVTLDTTLLQAGEATIQLRMYPKSGDEIDVSVVVMVQVGPTPTRILSGPVIVVPPAAYAPPPTGSAGVTAGVDYPVEALPDVEIPQFAAIESTPAPIQRLTPENIYDTLPGDPIQTDPILQDIEIAPVHIPTPPIVPIPR